MQHNNPSFLLLIKNPTAFLAFGFGSGLSPFIPGTVGTLASVPLYYALAQLPLLGYLVAIALSTVLGIYLCARATTLLGVHDHSGIVWDEFVGFWITMIAVPLELRWVVLGFIFFRFFDMLKPWPISLADKHIHGGFGIMFDDILAGVAAAVCLQSVIWWFG